MALEKRDLQLERPFWAITPDEVAAILEVPKGGLDLEEAERRFKHGRNEIKKSGRASKFKIFLSQFKSPLILILVFAVGVTVLVQDYKDASFILVAILINTALGFYQENKAEAALARLETYIKERTRVVRDGRDLEISAEEVVPGDLLKLTPGTRVPADARIIRANNLSLDEAILTGESLPVSKSVQAVETEAELSERTSMIFGGTLIVGGVGLAIVTSTGNFTELGKIAELVGKEKRGRTPLQKAIGKFAFRGSLFLIALTAVLFIVGISMGSNLFDMFLISVAIAVSAVPEGLPIALTVILAVGVERLAKRKGVVRKLLAAETLGSTTLILTDKTGTLTEASMKLEEIVSAKPDLTILELAMLNTDVVIGNPVGRPEEWELSGDSMEVAIVQAGVRRGIMPRDVFRRNHILETKPFNSKDKFAAVHARIGKTSRWVYLGAPDYLLEKAKVTKQKKEGFLSKIDELAFAGHRVLGVAVDENFTGLLAFRDPVRPSVKRAIQEIKGAGVNTIILTGDHKGTAVSVANELGFNINETNVLTGKDLRNIRDEEFVDALRQIKVFARVTPEDKLRITEGYIQLGEIVAVTGDGVNDAPALKGADIGIAVGSGSDVAKEAADLIILDDNFETVVEAIKEGRRILDNVRKVIVYLFSGILDELILIGGALLMGVALPLNALQILWVNFFADSFPAIAFAFEDGKSYLKDRPAVIKNRLLDAEMKFLIWVIGVATSFLLLFLYFCLLANEFDPQLVRTFIFAAFSVGTLFVVFSIKSLTDSIFRYSPFSNRYLVWGVMVGFILTGLAIYVPALQTLLDTAPLPGIWLLGVLAVGVVNIVAVELGKLIFRLKRKV